MKFCILIVVCICLFAAFVNGQYNITAYNYGSSDTFCAATPAPSPTFFLTGQCVPLNFKSGVAYGVPNITGSALTIPVYFNSCQGRAVTTVSCYNMTCCNMLGQSYYIFNWPTSSNPISPTTTSTTSSGSYLQYSILAVFTGLALAAW